jgi:hypothetical protein
MPLDNTPTNDEILQSSGLKSMLPATNVTAACL